MNLFTFVITLFLLFSFAFAFGQSAYHFPLKTGKENYLSGNFAEIRPNHFHAGFDIGTGNEVGFSVVAAKDGYVSRVRVEESGYGLAVYLKHPDGTTTLYAHLLSLDSKILALVRKKQYEQQSFEVEIHPKKNQLIYKKGQKIAKSGNSGSSREPHLHFEIRDKNGNTLEPMKHFAPYIADTIAPIPECIALRTFSPASSIKGEFGRVEFDIKRKNKNEYVVAPQNIDAYGLLGLEIFANDKANAATNTLAISRLVVNLDGKEVYRFQVDKLGYVGARYINEHINYEAYQQKKGYFQRCYVADGNKFKFYHTNSLRGLFQIKDTLIHHLDIALFDAQGNVSHTRMSIRHSKRPFRAERGQTFRETETNTIDNLLKINVLAKKGNEKAQLMTSRGIYELLPSYRLANQYVYLWDLRKATPHTFTTQHHNIDLPYKKMVAPSERYLFENEQITVDIPKGILYDTLFLKIAQQKDTFQIGDLGTPLLKSLFIKIRPTKKFNDKVKAYHIDRWGVLDYKGGAWKNNTLLFSTRDLGSFILLEDNEAPQIQLVSKKSNEIALKLNDNLSGIGSYRATLNGAWLLMHYDDSEQSLVSDDYIAQTGILSGTFRLVVKDRAGNEKIYEIEL